MNQIISFFNILIAILTVITTIFAFYQMIIYVIDKVTGNETLRKFSLTNNGTVQTSVTYYLNYYDNSVFNDISQPNPKKDTKDSGAWIMTIIFVIILGILITFTDIFQLAIVLLIFFATISATIALTTAFSIKLKNKSIRKFPIIRFTIITFIIIFTFIKTAKTILNLQKNIPDLLVQTKTVSFNNVSEIVNPFANNLGLISNAMFSNINVTIYISSLILLIFLILMETFKYIKPYLSFDSDIRENRRNDLLPQLKKITRKGKPKYKNYMPQNISFIILSWLLMFINNNPTRFMETFSSFQAWLYSN